MLPNMAEDWRFAGSPAVEQGGLRAYAGAQLRCRAENGVDVALGSLCVASSVPQEALRPDQQAALSRFADMFTADIVSASRESRKQQRVRMSELLAKIQPEVRPADVEDKIRDIITELYPHATITLQETGDTSLFVPGRTKPIALDDVQDGLWEDAELIDDIIIKENHQKLSTTQTVRAIIFPCMTQRRLTKHLVVTSREVQYVFDDVDAWFVERCALLLCNTVQEGRLREALDAKDRFLRGITHQLRTPIHGVLGSVDLLAEELASRNLLNDLSQSDVPNSQLTASSFLKTIRDSGRELYVVSSYLFWTHANICPSMSTVNNMLKLNRWADDGAEGESQPATLQTLKQIEADILHDVVSAIPDEELSQISIMFENQLAADSSMICLDMVLVKELLTALVMNALMYTKRGAVIITIAGSDDYSSIIFDVVDTGIGIKPEDQERIFEPYEKVDPHTRGAGLGLTLAVKIADALNGKVSLVSSTPGLGSHFRAEFFQPGFACPVDHHKELVVQPVAMPMRFHVIPADEERPDLVLHFGSYLKHRGFIDSPTPEGSMIIISYTPDATEFRKLVASVSPKQVAMTLTPAGATLDHLYGKHEVRFFSGPFSTARLEEIIQELDGIYKRLIDEPDLGETASGTCDKDTSIRTREPTTDVLSPADLTPRALIVDDNIVNLRIMRMYCEKRKIPYTTAQDGREAVDAFRASISENLPSNLVLMDLQMPHVDGVEATREIRELERKHALQPSTIFMVTGQDSETDKQRSFEAGATEYYVKPMSIKTLDQGIGKYFCDFQHGTMGKT